MQFTKIFSRLNLSSYKQLVYNTSRRFEQTSPQATEKMLISILQKRFPNAKEIQVKDTSGGCGQMFSIFIESEDFKNISVLKQHRLIYQTLNEQIKLMHGIHLVTKAS